MEEWADRVFQDGGQVAHWKAWGDDFALCGEYQQVWFGTGDFDEIETATRLPVCGGCLTKVSA